MQYFCQGVAGTFLREENKQEQASESKDVMLEKNYAFTVMPCIHFQNRAREFFGMKDKEAFRKSRKASFCFSPNSFMCFHSLQSLVFRGKVLIIGAQKRMESCLMHLRQLEKMRPSLLSHKWGRHQSDFQQTWDGTSSCQCQPDLHLICLRARNRQSREFLFCGN